MRPDWLVARVGIWTKVDFTPSTVIVSPRFNEFLGPWIGAGCFAGLAVYFAWRASSSTNLAAQIGVSVATAAAVTAVGVLSRRFKSGPILIILDTGVAPDERYVECTITQDQIDFVELRENLERRSDDSRLVQVFLHLKGDGSRRIVYQRYYNRWAKVRNMAKRLADRWKVELIDNLAPASRP